MKHQKKIGQQRQRRCYRVRNKLKKFSTRLRLSVFRSNKNIYVQIIDDEKGVTLVSASSQDKDLAGEIKYGGNIEAAARIGKAIAEKAKAAGIDEVTLDRREYKYHGRVAALADAAREAGLKI